MSRPSLRELQARERRERAERYRSRLLAAAPGLGVSVDHDMDIYDLMGAVHRAQDEREWPKVAEEAEALGIDPYKGLFWPFRRRRWITELQLAIYDRREYERLSHRYGTGA